MKRGFTVWELLIGLVVLGVIAAVLLPVFSRSRECCGDGPTCQSQLKNIGLGFQQYFQDFDSKFPPARQDASSGWVESLSAYIKSPRIYECIPVGKRPAPAGAGIPTDYFMNARLSGLSTQILGSTSLTVTSGDGDLGMTPGSAHYAVPRVPAEWLADETRPRRRHADGFNVGFADGHVKWYAKEKDLTSENAWDALPTFSPLPFYMISPKRKGKP